MFNLTLKYKINLQNHKYCVLCCSIQKVSEEIKARQDKELLTGMSSGKYVGLLSLKKKKNWI